MSRKGYIFDLCAALLIFVLFWPYSIDALTNTWDISNPHVVSYLIGPAQLAQVQGNLPNVNFFSQYSIGLPYLFSWLLSNDLTQVIKDYLYGITICVTLFSVFYYYLASRLYASRFWGLVFTLLMMILLANALFWTEPSSAPIRFFFFPICSIAILKMGLNNSRSILFSSILCAVSILNNTETGFYTLLAIGAVLFVISPSWSQLLKRLGLFLLGAVLFSGILCFTCYGRGVLSWQFLFGNIKPLFAYGLAGYGNYALTWYPKHWVWVQCLIMPGLAIITLSMLYYKNWTKRNLSNLEQALVFCCALGLLLLLKFMNRSYLAIGHINSGPLIIILGFYFVAALRFLVKTKHWRTGIVNSSGFTILLLIFSLFLYTFRENTPDRDYEVKYATTWLHLPSIFNYVTRISTSNSDISLEEQIKTKLPDEDVALIQEFATSKSEPVWIYSNNDWAYLILADRKPASTVLPLPYILLSQDLDLAQKRLAEGPKYFFVERGVSAHDNLINLFPHFYEHYQLLKQGKNLAAYEKIH